MHAPVTTDMQIPRAVLREQLFTIPFFCCLIVYLAMLAGTLLPLVGHNLCELARVCANALLGAHPGCNVMIPFLFGRFRGMLIVCECAWQTMRVTFARFGI